MRLILETWRYLYDIVLFVSSSSRCSTDYIERRKQPELDWTLPLKQGACQTENQFKMLWFSLHLESTLPLIYSTIRSDNTYRQTSNISYTCWSLRCSRSIACRRCSNYFFIIDLTPDFNGLGKTTARRDEKHLRFLLWCELYQRFDDTSIHPLMLNFCCPAWFVLVLQMLK